MGFDVYPFVRPAMFMLDPELAHGVGIAALKMGLYMCPPVLEDEALEIELAGLRLRSPVGLAAGFDKNADVVPALLRLGFGFVEAGTVTPQPQAGNPRPRIFRSVDDGAVINKMGFPNAGQAVFARHMRKALDRLKMDAGVIGINIGMNKTQTDPARDYCALMTRLGGMADYVTINVSSPNTPGLRDLQKRGPLLDLLGRVDEARRQMCEDEGRSSPPVFLKLAPDLSQAQQEELAQTAMDAPIEGVILGNTTLDRPETLPADFRAQAGGLSGAPLVQKSTDLVRNFYRLTGGTLPIIGVGGVASGADAYAKIRAGASAVQLYSSMVFAGPWQAYYVARGLLQCMKADGIARVADAVGLDAV